MKPALPPPLHAASSYEPITLGSRRGESYRGQVYQCPVNLVSKHLPVSRSTQHVKHARMPALPALRKSGPLQLSHLVPSSTYWKLDLGGDAAGRRQCEEGVNGLTIPPSHMHALLPASTSEHAVAANQGGGDQFPFKMYPFILAGFSAFLFPQYLLLMKIPWNAVIIFPFKDCDYKLDTQLGVHQEICNLLGAHPILKLSTSLCKWLSKSIVTAGCRNLSLANVSSTSDRTRHTTGLG